MIGGFGSPSANRLLGGVSRKIFRVAAGRSSAWTSMAAAPIAARMSRDPFIRCLIVVSFVWIIYFLSPRSNCGRSSPLPRLARRRIQEEPDVGNAAVRLLPRTEIQAARQQQDSRRERDRRRLRVGREDVEDLRGQVIAESVVVLVNAHGLCREQEGSGGRLHLPDHVSGDADFLSAEGFEALGVFQ